MNVKTDLREFLIEQGIENGKSIILKEIAAIEKEYFSSLQTDEVKELEKEMYITHLSDMNIDINYENVTSKVMDELRTSIYRVKDPVEPIEIGIWDTNLTEGKSYVIEIMRGDTIGIIDDSGELNPYLKTRFKNLATNLSSN